MLAWKEMLSIGLEKEALKRSQSVLLKRRKETPGTIKAI